jgi:hypothetical protein
LLPGAVDKAGDIVEIVLTIRIHLQGVAEAPFMGRRKSGADGDALAAVVIKSQQGHGGNIVGDGVEHLPAGGVTAVVDQKARQSMLRDLVHDGGNDLMVVVDGDNYTGFEHD